MITRASIPKPHDRIAAEMRGVIRDARRKRGLSQDDLGERIGAPRTWISKIENGHTNLSLVTLSRLAEALDTQPETLIFNARIRAEAKQGGPA